jgi:hypothetical protein
MAGTPASAGWVVLPGLMAGGDQGLAIRATSLKELRFLTTVRQQYDYSCGSAALATLLTYQYRDPVSEETAFKAMWDRGDKEKIRQEGFSLLDIKEYLEASGYAANGYVAPLEKLVEVGVPAIALINEKGYNHFVVVKGVKDDSVLLGDPSVGSRIMSRADFGKMWVNGILFVITGKKDRAVFNARSEWQILPKSPLQLASHHDSMARIGFLRPGSLGF